MNNVVTANVSALRAIYAGLLNSKKGDSYFGKLDRGFRAHDGATRLGSEIT